MGQKNVPLALSVGLHVDVGDCGMGMPVIRAWQAMKKLPIDGIIQLTSSHP